MRSSSSAREPLQRSKLWASGEADPRHPVPTAGTMLAALTDASLGGAAYDSELSTRQMQTRHWRRRVART